MICRASAAHLADLGGSPTRPRPEPLRCLGAARFGHGRMAGKVPLQAAASAGSSVSTLTKIKCGAEMKNLARRL